MDAARNFASQIGNASGIATATGGGGLWANSHWEFLNDNAVPIGVVCTVMTFCVFVASKAFEAILKYREHKVAVNALKDAEKGN